MFGKHGTLFGRILRHFLEQEVFTHNYCNTSNKHIQVHYHALQPPVSQNLFFHAAGVHIRRAAEEYETVVDARLICGFQKTLHQS
jgi:hypothetical protein